MKLHRRALTALLSESSFYEPTFFKPMKELQCGSVHLEAENPAACWTAQSFQTSVLVAEVAGVPLSSL